jgi:hypothetical protein
VQAALIPRSLLAVLAVMACVGAFAAIASSQDVHVSTAKVPSNRDAAKLRCQVVVLAEDEQKLEAFHCVPTGALDPPPGRYTQASTTWYSDVDRRRAVQHDIVIARSGALSGWAAYASPLVFP